MTETTGENISKFITLIGAILLMCSFIISGFYFFSKSADYKTFIKIPFLLCMIGIGGYLTGKGLGLLSEIARRGQGGQQQESQQGQQQESQPNDVQKIAHDTLLKEIHNIDHITEMHSQIVLAIMAALIIFASYQLKSPPVVVYLISIVGVSISIEWMLKIIRHRKIFRECYDKVTELEELLGIDALRPLPRPHKKLFSLDGFTLLIWLAILFLLFWIVLLLIVATGCIN